MAYNGAGVFNLYTPGNPTVTGTTISSTWANNTLSDIATGLSTAVCRDGQSTISANIPMSSFKFTGLGAGSAATDSVQFQQVQSGAATYLTSVSGVDTITASLSTPALAAYAAGNTFRFVSAGANTGAATLNINSLGAKSITKNGTTALAAGDIPSGAVVEVVYDGTQFQLINIVFSVPVDSVTSASLADSALGFAMINGTLTASVAANALTIAVKTKAGTDPSSTDPVLVVFRNATITDGTYTVVSVTAATSLVVSSGSTLGTVNATAARLAVILLNNAGTAELAINNLSGGVNLDETGVISTTAEGGAGAADSATVIYSTTARSNVAYRVVGLIDITEATAGTWASAPTKITLVGAQPIAMSSLGYGQTWQTVTRTLATTYYNTTGRPITCIIQCNLPTGGNIIPTVNGFTLPSIANANTTAQNFAYLFIVPPGQSYSSSGNTATLSAAELR